MTSLPLPFFSDEKTSIFSDLLTITFVFISKHIAQPGVHELKCVYFFSILCSHNLYLRIKIRSHQNTIQVSSMANLRSTVFDIYDFVQEYWISISTVKFPRKEIVYEG